MYTKEELTVLTEPLLDIRHKMDLLLLIGRLLMENGANTTQIVRDMRRAGAYMGIPESYCQLHVSYNTLMLNINNEEHSYTVFQKTENHGINMGTISEVSRLTWQALENDYTIEEFEQHLRAIAKRPPHYPTWVVNISAGLACGGFAMLFGGSIMSAWVTTVCAFIAFIVRKKCQALAINEYITISITAFVGSALALASSLLFGEQVMIYALITASLFMIPGVPLVNAINDMINSHIVSGMTRAFNTILIMGSLTVGISMALYFDAVSNFTNINIAPQGIYVLQILAAFVGAAGFAIIFNTPKKFLIPVGIGGMITVFIRNFFVVNAHFSLMGAAFMGAAAVGILAVKVASRLETAPFVIVIPSVLPLIPGVLLYRSLFAVLKINSLTPDMLFVAERTGVTGVMTFVCIAVGVAVPSIFAQRYIDKEKKARLRNLLQARKTHVIEESM